MKKIFNWGLCLMLAAGATACSGEDNDSDKGQQKPAQGPYTLHADKTEIEADGKDAVTFSVTDANGQELTSDVTIRNAETGNTLGRGVKTFTSLVNYTYKFSASYQGEPCENEVTVTAKNRKAYETYYRNNIVYKLTSVTCVYCPNMTQAFNAIAKDVADHIIMLGIHGYMGEQIDPWVMRDQNQTYANRLFIRYNGGQASYPTAIFNMNAVLPERTTTAITELNTQQMRDFPATCGIKIATKYEEGKIKIDATLASDKGGEYELVYAIVQDNLKFEGNGTYPDREGGYYDHVCTYISSNYERFSAQRDVIKVEAGAEHTAETFAIDAPNLTEEKLANTHVVVFATRANGEGSIVDNAAKCAINASVDYKLNE